MGIGSSHPLAVVDGKSRRLLSDLRRASRTVKKLGAGATDKVGRAALAGTAIGGLIAAGVIAALLVRRRRRRAA